MRTFSQSGEKERDSDNQRKRVWLAGITLRTSLYFQPGKSAKFLYKAKAIREIITIFAHSIELTY